MVSLKAKQLLVKAARINDRKTNQLNRKQIERKVHQIKHLTKQHKIPKSTVRKEIVHLEKQLHGVFRLETKLKKSTKDTVRLKEQIKELKKQLATSQDTHLKKKVTKLSHLLGDALAKKEIEAQVQQAEQKQESPTPKITLHHLDQLQQRILAIKQSGKYPLEKITPLEQRLAALERKLDPASALSPTGPTGAPRVKHKMLFGPQTKEINVTEIGPLAPEVKELKDDISELPLPPPPRIKKK